jgi:hypothetical protein
LFAADDAIFTFFVVLVAFDGGSLPGFAFATVTVTGRLADFVAAAGFAVAFALFAGDLAAIFFGGAADFFDLPAAAGLRAAATGFFAVLVCFCGLRAGAFFAATGFFAGPAFFAAGLFAAAAAGLRLEFAMILTIVPRRARVIA